MSALASWHHFSIPGSSKTSRRSLKSSRLPPGKVDREALLFSPGHPEAPRRQPGPLEEEPETPCLLQGAHERSDLRGPGEDEVAASRSGGFGRRQSALEVLEETLELELLEDGEELLVVRLLLDEGPEVKGEGDVAGDRGEPLAQERLLPVGIEERGSLPGKEGKAGEAVLEGPVFPEELHCRFGADPGNTGNVVAGVPDETLEVRELPRLDAELLPHLLLGEALELADAFARVQRLAVRGDELEEVLVPGDAKVLEAFLGSGARDCADEVVRLVALDLKDGHAQSAQHLLNQGKLGPQLFRGALPVALVGLVLLVPEGSLPLVKGNDEVVRILLADHLLEHVREPVDRVREEPGGGGKEGNGVEGPVGEAVPVENDKLLHKSSPLRSLCRRHSEPAGSSRRSVPFSLNYSRPSPGRPHPESEESALAGALYNSSS